MSRRTLHFSLSTGIVRLYWARVYVVDVTRCPACSGQLRLVVELSDPILMRIYLTGVDLVVDPSARAVARLAPQRDLELVVEVD